MSNSLTYFPIFMKGGFKGNLAKAPEFDNTEDGKAFVKITLFMKAADSPQTSVKQNTGKTPSLVVYVRAYDEDVMAASRELDKGDFINVTEFAMVNIACGIHEDTGEAFTCLFVVAQDFIPLKQAKRQARVKEPAAKKPKAKSAKQLAKSA